MAICDAWGNRVEGQCLDKGGRTGKALEAWVLTKVLGQEVTAKEVQRQEYQEILREGKVTYETGPGRPISVVYRVISFSYEGGDDEEPPGETDPPRNSVEKNVSFRCTACLTVNNQDLCETGIGAKKEEAQSSAMKKLAEQIKNRLGYSAYSQLGNPKVTCE